MAIRADGLALGGAKVIGSRLAVVVAIDAGDVEFLADQRMTIDEENDEVTARADLGSLVHVALVPLETTAKVTGFPATAEVDELVALTIRTDEPAGEDVIDLRTASYTDDLGGLWVPAGGEITNTVLPKNGEQVRESVYDYACVGATQTATFLPSIRLVYDVIAPVPGAPTDVVHRVLPVGQLSCQP